MRWFAANWIGVFAILAMLAFVLLLVVMMLSPEPRQESSAAAHTGAATRKHGRDEHHQRV